MTVSFYVKDSTAVMRDHEHEGRSFTSLVLREADGSHVDLLVDASNAAEALAIADTIRAVALKHLPAPEPAGRGGVR